MLAGIYKKGNMKPMINLKEPFVLTPQFKEEKKQFLAFGEKKKCLQARADKKNFI